jgi:hypothetical protein
MGANWQPNDADAVTRLAERVAMFGKYQLQSDGGLPDVTEADFLELVQIVQHLLALHWSKGPDGCAAVTMRANDLTRYQSLAYWPIPHTHKCRTREEFMAAMHIAEMNLAIATTAFQTMWKELEYMEYPEPDPRDTILAELAKVIRYPNYDRNGKDRDTEYAAALHRLSRAIREVAYGDNTGTHDSKAAAVSNEQPAGSAGRT